MNRYKLARERSGLSIKQVEMLTGLSGAVIFIYEEEELQAPNEDTVKKFASLYGVDFHWLLTGETQHSIEKTNTINTIMESSMKNEDKVKLIGFINSM